MSLATLTDVMGATLGALGDPLGEDRGLPAATKAVVVLIDGLGYHQLAARSGHAPFLRRRLGDPIRTVSPSTTASAISSLGTGLEPGQTAMVGYALKDPSTGEPFNLIAWNSPIHRAENWQLQPTWGEKLAGAGRPLAICQDPKFVGSGLTNAAWRGGVPYSARRLEDRVDAALSALQSHDLVYLYWGEIDHIGHGKGWQSPEWTSELEQVDSELSRLARLLPPDTLLLITSDHGMVDVTDKIDVARVDELRQGVDLIAGEERAVQVYTKQPEELAERWRDYLGDRAKVMTKGEWIDSGLLGEVSAQSESVIGDVVAFSSATYGIVDSRWMSNGALGLIGVHGSLTEDEMEIPCIVEVSS